MNGAPAWFRSRDAVKPERHTVSMKINKETSP